MTASSIHSFHHDLIDHRQSGSDNIEPVLPALLYVEPAYQFRTHHSDPRCRHQSELHAVADLPELPFAAWEI